jgi:exodeoxyribonuclease VII large subunit
MLLAHRLGSYLPRATQMQRLRLAQLAGDLQRRVARGLTSQHQRLDSQAARLRALDPQQVLARGYAWLADADEQPVTSVQQISAGQRLRAVLHDGTADMQVTQVRSRTSR